MTPAPVEMAISLAKLSTDEPERELWGWEGWVIMHPVLLLAVAAQVHTVNAKRIGHVKTRV
jgi:hypothetical protein